MNHIAASGVGTYGRVIVAAEVMTNTIHYVSAAVQHLNTTGRVATLAELREVIATVFGADAAAISDDELRAVLLELHGPRHASATLIQPGASVTCSPMPEGWIPSDQFRGGR